MFTQQLDHGSRCTWIEDGVRCESGAIAGYLPLNWSTCYEHSWKLVGKGYYDAEHHYVETEPSPYRPRFTEPLSNYRDA